MPNMPEIDVAAVTSALKSVEQVERAILTFARECGLPLDTVDVYEMRGRAYARLSSYKHRIFKDSHTGRRNLTVISAALGRPMWETIEEAADAYRAKREAA